jgi:hypothetical protein
MMYHLILKSMKSKLILGAVILFFVGFMSCQKMDTGLNNSASLSANLNGAVTELASTAVTATTTADIQSCSVEKFDSASPAQYIGAIPGGFPGHGKGWGFGRFSIPHIDKCATVTVSSDTFPKEIIIDYGSACADEHGHTKQGKIIITMSDTAIAAGAVKTIVYQDFYIDSMKVEYSATTKNLGKNELGNWVIENKSTQTITKNGNVVTQTSDELIEWVSGFETTDKSDDVFYKSGTGSLTVNDSLSFSRKITKPLLYDRSCEFILSGTEELYRNGNTIVIDYGDGECDSVATVTTNGTTEEIDLHSREFHKGGDFEKHCPSGGGFGKHQNKHSGGGR